MLDLMLDIETLGRGPGCVVTSVAVVPFNMNGSLMGEDELEDIALKDKFSFRSDLLIGEQMSMGFKVDPDTFSWWMKQKPEVRIEMWSGTTSLSEFHKLFADYFVAIKAYWGDYRLWATAPKLDFGCVSYLFTSQEVDYPVLFSAERCARTLRETAKLLHPKFKYTRGKALHNSEDDCERQIVDIQQAYSLLKDTPKEEEIKNENDLIGKI